MSSEVSAKQYNNVQQSLPDCVESCPVDRDVVNIQLVPLDKEQEQVERPFELRELDLVGVGQEKALWTKFSFFNQ